MKRRTVITFISLLVLVPIFIITITLLAKSKTAKPAARIVSSAFVGYDFARAVTSNSSDLALLLKPGTEAHAYEPTPEDIIAIKNADLFIYVGGESDEWISDLLSDNSIPPEKTLRLMDLVKLKEEELSEGMEPPHDPEHASEDSANAEETEYDEHIWTSPLNAIALVQGVKDKLSKLYPENATLYAANADAYASRLTKIDTDIRSIVSSSAKKELVFGDRFPFRYFTDEYGLAYYAAFPGCSDQTEASTQTIAFLISKIKTDNIKVVLKIELSSDKLAKTIASETGAQVLTLNSAHNISQDDFDSGLTYADIMESNVRVLQEALK